MKIGFDNALYVKKQSQAIIERINSFGGKSLLPKGDGAWNRPFRLAGRHTLFVVITHQIVNMLLLALVTALFVDFGNFVIF